MNKLESLCKAVDQNEDKYLVGVLADFLEETGDDRHRGLRWLLANNKAPRWYSVEQVWSWGDCVASSKSKERDDLPQALWNGLNGRVEFPNYPWSKAYRVLSTAYLDAARAWSELNR